MRKPMDINMTLDLLRMWRAQLVIEAADESTPTAEGDLMTMDETIAIIEGLRSLVSDFYTANAEGKFTLPDANYILITRAAEFL